MMAHRRLIMLKYSHTAYKKETTKMCVCCLMNEQGAEKKANLIVAK